MSRYHRFASGRLLNDRERGANEPRLLRAAVNGWFSSCATAVASSPTLPNRKSRASDS